MGVSTIADWHIGAPTTVASSPVVLIVSYNAFPSTLKQIGLSGMAGDRNAPSISTAPALRASSIGSAHAQLFHSIRSAPVLSIADTADHMVSGKSLDATASERSSSSSDGSVTDRPGHDAAITLASTRSTDQESISAPAISLTNAGLPDTTPLTTTNTQQPRKEPTIPRMHKEPLLTGTAHASTISKSSLDDWKTRVNSTTIAT
jgi:hypothetical protein